MVAAARQRGSDHHALECSFLVTAWAKTSSISAQVDIYKVRNMFHMLTGKQDPARETNWNYQVHSHR